MEFDRSVDRLPFHDLDEAESTAAGAAPSRDVRIRHLQRVPLFSGFDEAELRRVAELARIVEVPAGQEMTHTGAAGDAFFVIIDGTVAVETPAGTRRRLQPGEFFGEMSLIDGEPRSATITAITDLRLLVVDRLHFWRVLDEMPDLTRRILTELSRRVRSLEQLTDALSRSANPA
jgi:CRP-like cAMP-binding protein